MTSIVIHNNRRYERAVRDQRTYPVGATLGLATICGVEYVVRLVEGDTWKTIAPAGRPA